MPVVEFAHIHRRFLTQTRSQTQFVQATWAVTLQAQSSGAGVLAINTLGGTTTTVKQAAEFGLGKRMTVVLTTPKNRDIDAIGLPIAAGQLVVTSFYEDVSPEARAWSDKFLARVHAAPSEVHAGVYSSVRHFLQAVKDTNTTDGDIVAARMGA